MSVSVCVLQLWINNVQWPHQIMSVFSCATIAFQLRFVVGYMLIFV